MVLFPASSPWILYQCFSCKWHTIAKVTFLQPWCLLGQVSTLVFCGYNLTLYNLTSHSLCIVFFSFYFLNLESFFLFPGWNISRLPWFWFFIFDPSFLVPLFLFTKISQFSLSNTQKKYCKKVYSDSSSNECIFSSQFYNSTPLYVVKEFSFFFSKAINCLFLPFLLFYSALTEKRCFWVLFLASHHIQISLFSPYCPTSYWQLPPLSCWPWG